jgi:hypothetical protein
LIEKREMTEDTVIRHLGILKQQEPSFNLDKLSPASEVIEMVKEAVTDLKKESDKKNLNELGELKLKPIFDALDEEVSYIDIKLALLFI